jgi:hypothetical protein
VCGVAGMRLTLLRIREHELLFGPPGESVFDIFPHNAGTAASDAVSMRCLLVTPCGTDGICLAHGGEFVVHCGASSTVYPNMPGLLFIS